ncbi:hypothetical protein F4805DRAFT_411862 [Annulohypoxylon moriforme]|nr:hypothetical protein F4805DRAFT_411862 [Annulohypoxylon moriforme]
MSSSEGGLLDGIDIWTTPSIPPPPGVVPNFVNPPSRGPMIRAGMYSILPIMVAFVVLRIYTRARLTHALGSDDYLCLLSTGAIIAFSGLVLSFMDNPEGRHGWDIPLGELLTNHYWIEATLGSLLTYNLGSMFTKLTLLSLYLRIFNPSTWARVAIWLGMTISTLFYAATSFGYLGLCVHLGVPVWESMQDLHCANNAWTIAKANGWYSLISNIYVLVLPLSLVWRLKLNMRHKLGIMAIFLTGLAAVVISAASLVKRYGSVTHDRTWENCVIFLYNTIELAFGIICSCMPVIVVTLKNSMTNMNLMWDSIRRYGTRHLPGTSRQVSKLPSHTISEERLPEIPSGTVSGLRSFVRRIYRSNNQSTANLTYPATFVTVESVDQDYHIQLRQMYKPWIKNIGAPLN